MEPFISQSIWSSAGRGPAGIYISESACEAVANHRDGPFHFCKRCKLRTGGIFFLMLKFQCVFCFEICILKGRGMKFSQQTTRNL